jgi:uncharacterized protein with von Willebrand factor type A (vWA) domain
VEQHTSNHLTLALACRLLQRNTFMHQVILALAAGEL